MAVEQKAQNIGELKMTTDLIQDALKSGDLAKMRDLIGVMEDQLEENPEMYEAVQGAQVQFTRKQVEDLVSEGLQAAEKEDAVAHAELTDVLGQLEGLITGTRTEVQRALALVSSNQQPSAAANNPQTNPAVTVTQIGAGVGAAQKAQASTPTQKTTAPPNQQNASSKQQQAPQPQQRTAPNTQQTQSTPQPQKGPRLTGNELRTETNKIMLGILEDNGLYNPDFSRNNPVSDALLKMVSDLDKAQIAELGKFLKKPSEGYLPAEADQYVQKTAQEVKILIAGKEKELKDLQFRLQDQQERRKQKGMKVDERQAIQDEITSILTDIRAVEQDKDYMEMALSYQKGSMRYDSVEQVMYMTGMWMAQKKAEKDKTAMPTELDIYKDVHERIENEKRGGKHKERLGFMKPSLKLILTSLAGRNAHLETVGEEKLAELAKAWNDPAKVEVWLNSVEGADDYKMEKVVAPLIAYLQLAVREGLSNNIPGISRKHTEQLLTHLKSIRHKYAKARVKEKLDPNASDVDKMTAYFDEITNLTVSEQEISREAITLDTSLKTLGKAGGIGLAALAGIWGGAKWAGGKAWGGAKGAAGGTRDWVKGWSDESKAGAERGGKRAVIAGSVAGGAMAAGVALSPAALIAMPFVFAPEMWKYRREIVAGAGRVGLAAGAATAAILTMPALLVPKYSKWLLGTHKKLKEGMDEKIFSELPSTKMAANDGEYKRKPKKKVEKKEEKKEVKKVEKTETQTEEKKAA